MTISKNYIRYDIEKEKKQLSKEKFVFGPYKERNCSSDQKLSLFRDLEDVFDQEPKKHFVSR